MQSLSQTKDNHRHPKQHTTTLYHPYCTMRCGFLEAALSLDGTLGKKDQHKRTLFFAINVALLIPQTVVFFSLDHPSPVFAAGVGVSCIAALSAVLTILCKCKVTTAVMICAAYAQLIAVILIDLNVQAFGSSIWSTLVLIVDFLLVMEVSAKHTIGVVVVSCGWIVLIAVEQVFRFGLLDLPGLPPQYGAYGRWADYVEDTSCTNLPCPNPGSSLWLIHALEVFIVDFIATRGFARQILKEQATMERTINTVQEIASLLAGYDVERVAELLAEHEGQLPEGMAFALRTLEENLRVYKAYLPKTCLPFDEESLVSFGNDIAQDDVKSFCSSVSEAVTSTSSRNVGRSCVQALALTPMKATLLTLNIKSTLRLLEEDVAGFSQLFTSVLQKALQATEARRGMVDVFVGDRIHCSFNVSKQCASHATSALHTATMLMKGEGVTTHVNMGVATGQVLRGDMGCHEMRRFSMVGELLCDVLAIERAGRALGCDVLCNRFCVSEAECEHQLRLIPRKVELAAGCEAVLGELVVPTEAPVAKEAEWMYQIGGKDWEDYNHAVRAFLRGEASAEDVAAAARAGNCAKYPVHVSASLNCLCLPFPAKHVNSI